jgi:hypothetical protein
VGGKLRYCSGALYACGASSGRTCAGDTVSCTWSAGAAPAPLPANVTTAVVVPGAFQVVPKGTCYVDAARLESMYAWAEATPPLIVALFVVPLGLLVVAVRGSSSHAGVRL